MAEDTAAAAKRRASFARSDRLKKEAMAQATLPLESQKTRTTRQNRDNAAQKTDQEKKTAIRKEIQDKFAQRKADAARRTFTRKAVDQKAIEREKAERKQEADRKAADKKVDQEKKAAIRQEVQRKIAQRKADAGKQEFNRKAVNQKAIDREKAERQKEAAHKSEEQKALAKETVQKQATERRAAAHVDAQYKKEQADQLAEHRRQTDRLRLQHRGETASRKIGEDTAITRHHHAVKIIDERERRTLTAFDVKRNSLPGRAIELVKGKAHFEKARADLVRGFESERLHKHRDLEALKERQFTATQDQRQHQAQERKAMFDGHKAARFETEQRQQKDRPRLIEERLQAVSRNAAIERSHEQTKTHERGLTRAFPR